MRNVNKIFWLTALSLAFVACQNEDIVNEQIQQGADVYTLQGIVDGSNAQSRAQVQLNSQEPDKEFFIWNSEDLFTVYDIDAETLAGNTFTISESYQNDNPTGEARFDTETPMKTGHQIVAVYPAQTTNAESIDLSITEMTLDGTQSWEQNIETEWCDYMRQNMFMYASATTVSSATSLSFKHLCSMVRITYTNATTGEQNLTQCKLVGSDTFFASAATLDVKTGELSNPTAITEMGMNFENLHVKIGQSQDIYLLFFPGTAFTPNDTLTCKIYTDSDTPATITLNVSDILKNNEGDTGFETGKRYWLQVMQTNNGLIWKKDVAEGVISNMSLINAIGYMDGISKDENGFIKIEESKAALEKVTEIRGVYNLEGIEYLPNLETIDCWSTKLSKLDVSANTKLKSLQCISCSLTSLDLSKNTELTSLNCGSNQLTVLNLSNNINLTELICYNNKLTSLVLPDNPNLTRLNCRSNQIESLNLSNYSNLTELNCTENLLTSLNLSNNKELKYLDCGMNKLSTLDISNNLALITLDCGDNRLTSLDISNNIELTEIECGNNHDLVALDISKNTKLISLGYSWTAIKSLDVSKHTALITLRCGGVTSLDISNNTALEELFCDTSTLTSLDLSKQKSLKYLYCGNSHVLTSLNISENTELEVVHCFNCRLQELDITHNANLSNILCGDQWDENGNALTLTLHLTSEQQAKWDSEWCKNWGHELVNPVVSDNPVVSE